MQCNFKLYYLTHIELKEYNNTGLCLHVAGKLDMSNLVYVNLLGNMILFDWILSNKFTVKMKFNET